MIDGRVNETEELLTMLEGRIEAYLNVLSQHLFGGIEKNHALSRDNRFHDIFYMGTDHYTTVFVLEL
jgi:hypothetical protein